MPDVLELPAIRARAHLTDVGTYHTLGKLNLISERTELIRGVIINQMPKGPLHSFLMKRLGEFLERSVTPGFHVRREQPLTLWDSEPEPDLAVVSGADSDYLAQQPTTAQLVVEICVTTEDLDRAKLALYAEAGVRECWLVLAETGLVERHTDSREGSYQQIERGATLTSSIFSSVTLPPPGLFPAA